MAISITTLIENSPGEHLALKTEHGISFFLQKKDRRLLFDTGQSHRFLENARELGIGMDDLDYVVLSHGHYDHTGGFRALCDRTAGFELVMGGGFFDLKYGYRNGSYEYLGNNFDEAFLRNRAIPHRFVHDRITDLGDGIYIVTDFVRRHDDETVNERFVLRQDGRTIPDRFDDEILVAVDSPDGLIILLGCAHPGMKNMLDTAAEALDRPIAAVLGGTHLVEASRRSLERSVAYLSDESIRYLGVSHCTGATGMQLLEELNPRYFHNRTGTSLFVEDTVS